MAPFTTEGIAEGGPMDPRIIGTIVGCSLAFIGLIVGFRLVARKSCCARRDHARSPPATPEHGRSSASASASASSLRHFTCMRSFRKRKAKERTNAERDTFASPPPPYLLTPSHLRSPASDSGWEPGFRIDSVGTTTFGHAAPASPPPAYVYRSAWSPVASIDRGR